MINKHAEEMKVEGLLGVSRMVDRLLNKQPVSMESNESNESITQSMVMSGQEGNDAEAEAMSMGMNMVENMKTDSGTQNNDTDNEESNGDANETSSTTGNKTEYNGMTGGGLYKRFFKSKKNKKSVYL